MMKQERIIGEQNNSEPWIVVSVNRDSLVLKAFLLGIRRGILAVSRFIEWLYGIKA